MICQIQIKLLLKSSSFNGQRLSTEPSAFWKYNTMMPYYGYISAVLACMLANHEIFSLHFSMPIGGSCETFLDDVLYGNKCASVVWDDPAIQRGST